MNTNKQRTKSISIALLVVLASIMTTGLVLADHYPPVGDVSVNSLKSFEQYQAAIDHMERDREATSLLNRTNSRRLNALAQGYNARIQLNRANIRRLGAFVQSYDARIQMEEDRNAAFEKSLVPNSGDSWFLVEHFSFSR